MSCSERKIFKLLQAGATLNSDQIRWLRAAPKQVGFNDLVALAKITDDSERSKVCIALTNGEAKNVGAARRQIAAETGAAEAPVSPEEAAYRRLVDAWTRAPKRAKRSFLEEYGADLRALQDEGHR